MQNSSSNLGRFIFAAAILSGLVSAPAVTVDGQRDVTGYTVGASQVNPTGWGANNTLANAYYSHDVSSVSLFVGGRPDGNAFLIFFDTVAGGQNTLNNAQGGGDGYAINNLNGFTFDSGFTADYMLRVYGDGSGNAYVNFFDLGGNANSYLGNPNPNPLVSGAFTLARDWQSVTPGYDPATITSGFEMSVSYAALGLTGPTDTWRASIILANGNSDYLSNQQLGSLPNGTGDIAGSGSGNWNQGLFIGEQYFTIVGVPEPSVFALAGLGLAGLLIFSRRKA